MTSGATDAPHTMTQHPSTFHPRLLAAGILLVLGCATGLAAESTPGADDSPDSPRGRNENQQEEQNAILHFVRAYEPVELGLTKDPEDEWFMDFTLSLMFPLLGHYWDDQLTGEPWLRWNDRLNTQNLGLFLSGTVRAGQYIWDRPSAPVVEKRFNPQLFLRWWIPDDRGTKSANRFLDLVLYAHESNGQSITTEAAFNAQYEIYRQLEDFPDSQVAMDRARRSARDALSRGWDYIGLNASWSWRADRHVALFKLREYLPGGQLQQGAEQSHDWEDAGAPHPRRQYDGLSIQYTVFGNRLVPKWPFLTGRTTFTVTTGLSNPGRHLTYEADVGIALWGRPLSLWFRHGYNSNLTNYYRRDSSWGGGISIWSFGDSSRGNKKTAETGP